MLRLTQDDLGQIKEVAQRSYPHECCGILIGSVQRGNKVVSRFVAVENQRTDSPANRYLIPPEVVQQVEGQVRRTGEEIVGFFHSHPDVSAQPSNYDRDHAWPWYSYVIVSVKKRQAAEILNWQLKEDRSGFEPETLELVDV